MKHKTQEWNPYGKAKEILTTFEAIIADYRKEMSQGMTIRQVHYQFVARHEWPNNPQTYNTIQRTLNLGRKAGLVDYDDIIDSARSSDTWPCTDIRSFAVSVPYYYRHDYWGYQPVKIEAWVEKDAAFEIVKSVASERRIDVYSCRGCNSTTLKFEAIKRIKRNISKNQRTVILYLGDHDYSGLRMDETYQEWFEANGVSNNVEFIRLGLTLEQVREYDLPTALNVNEDGEDKQDNNKEWYMRTVGIADCWELDALRPRMIKDRFRQEVDRLIDEGAWRLAEREESTVRDKIKLAISNLRLD